MNTRGLQGGVANRIASEIVTLDYLVPSDNGDGSATSAINPIERPASVGALQPWDIERLEKAGIIVKNGITIVIGCAPENPPDTIRHGLKSYRVVNWAFTYEYDEYTEYDEYAEHFGTVIATCDEKTIGSAK